jgi:hypothetical protein
MRFVSKYQRYAIGLRPEKKMVLASGDVQVMQQHLDASFIHGMAQPHEVEAGLAHFQFLGLPEGVNPAHRMSVFDTRIMQQEERLSDDERMAIENELLTNGRLGGDYILVEEPKIPVPWPNYPGADVDTIVARVAEDGYDPAEIIAYEQQNANRPEVLAALEAIGSEPVEEPIKA